MHPIRELIRSQNVWVEDAASVYMQGQAIHSICRVTVASFSCLSFPKEVGQADHKLECSNIKAGCQVRPWAGC